MKFLVMEYEVSEYNDAVKEASEIDKWINEAVEELESAKKSEHKDDLEFTELLDQLRTKLKKQRARKRLLSRFIESFREGDNPHFRKPNFVKDYRNEISKKHSPLDIDKWNPSFNWCTRCGCNKYNHFPREGKGCVGMCNGRCESYSTNQSLRFGQKNCNHKRIELYGQLNNLRAYCTNTNCRKDMTETEEGKNEIRKTLTLIPTEEMWKEENDISSIEHSDIIEIDIDDTGKLTKLRKLCNVCYSAKHATKDHWKQSYSEMVDSLKTAMDEFGQKYTSEGLIPI